MSKPEVRVRVSREYRSLVNALLFRALSSQDPLEFVTLLSRFYLVATIGEVREVALRALRIAMTLRLIGEVPRHPLASMPAGGYAHRLLFCPLNRIPKDDLDMFGLRLPEKVASGIPEPQLLELKADFILNATPVLLKYLRKVLRGVE